MPAFIPGVRDLADRYQGFVLDQWGVLHDGAAPYPQALATLAELHRRGKRIVLLSNSGRRAEFSRRHLDRMGFDLAMLDAVVTSGETAWTLLLERRIAGLDRPAERCFLITRSGDREVIEGTGIEIVDDVATADFLFLAGVDSPELGLEDYRPMLESAVARGLVAVCSNPDLAAPSPGGPILAPGGLAMAYAAMGGDVVYVGKPHAPIYELVREALEGLEAGQIVAVGDSLAHDVKGANDAGLAAAFVSGGLHEAEFAGGLAETQVLARLDALAVGHGGRPDWVLRRFVW